MPLTDDQRAMLQLLLQRGQTYDDISGLLGLDVEQVRSRARAALTEIGGEDPDRDVSLTDYLLGQADPIGRADAARQLQSNGRVRDLADRLSTQLRVLAPGAELPELPDGEKRAAKRNEAKAPAPPPAADPGEAAVPAPPSPGGFTGNLTQGQKQAIAALLGGGILIVIVVLLATGVFSSGGGGGTSTGNSASSGASQTATNQGPPRAILTGPNGSSAKGVAVFARLRNVPVLQVTAANLDPTPKGEVYAVWLYRSKQVAIPLGAVKVAKSGQLQARVQLPPQILQYVGDRTLTAVDVSLTSQSAFQSKVRAARKKRGLPPYTGTSVLHGAIIGSGLSPAAGGNSSGSAG